MNLYKMSARDAITRMRDSSCSSEELVTSCLKQIKFRENVVGVRAFLDEEASLNQSRQADRRMKDNNSSTPFLNWVPVGIKDIFDTRDMPTENGSVTCLDRRPEQDTLAIERLRNAGAVIMGKTVTAELAVYTPGKTTNPHDPARTPGGSSSGSAAAVASGMVPMATGMQKNGSLIGPASFCGVVGYKPTFGMIPWSGILRQAPSLDQVGVFTRNVGDSTLLASVLTGRQECYSDTLPWPNLNFALLMRKDQSPSRLAFAKTPVW
ncbi:MAG: amidase, partial [Deltaproteobacteria bacterium]|nr:amidase [Deltaproteobacteria bacterium]